MMTIWQSALQLSCKS